MQESLVFLILGVGRLREDQLIYVESRENVFFYDMGPLNELACDNTGKTGYSCLFTRKDTEGH